MKKLTEYCKSQYKKAEGVIHRWGHIVRTANGAVWFVKVLDGAEREQQLAYVAGILHDIVRPNTELISHAEASSERALQILQNCSEFTEDEKQKICEAIKDHRKPVEWKTPLHQSVYLSDKIFEHMGAYLDFRASVWAGELSHSDYKGMEPLEAVLNYYERASKKFLTGEFPCFVDDLVTYQTDWNRSYLEDLQNGEDWAIDMATRLFDSGRKKEEFEVMLMSFKPSGRKQSNWRNEMSDYIQGKKFQHFQRLLK